jgi:putative oxidoreductase
MNTGINIGILILRISTGIMMILHGFSKILKGVSFIQTSLVESGWPSWIAYGVYIGEIIAPIMLIIGWRTRFAALLIGVTMVFATFLVHADELLKLGSHGEWAIELQGLYFFAAVALVFTGGGKYAVSRKSFGD